ncbi:MAG TPA: hypothetical protein VHI93_07835, partial [Candidatus Thermoplasmatota archaeon]|nr:hypothetical protein [Candidatus Thermoplasmatota archaeon]
MPGQSPDLSTVVARDQESYLFVTNGTLTTTLKGSDYRLYVGSGATVSASSLLLRGATGHLGVGGLSKDLKESTVALDGQLGVSLHGKSPNAPFALEVSGEPDRVVVDGVAVPLPAAAGGSLGWLWLGAVGLVASPLLGFPALRRRTTSRRRERLAERIDRLESQSDFAAAEPLARKLVELAPEDPRAHFQWGVLLSRLRQHLKAMQCHEEAHRLLREHPDETLLVENAFAAALAAAIAQA